MHQTPPTNQHMRNDVSRETLTSAPMTCMRLSFQFAVVHEEEAPSGMLARGHYNVRSRFVDDDGHIHLEFQWSFDIAKEWAH